MWAKNPLSKPETMCLPERDEPDGLDKDPYREDHIIAEKEGICQSQVFHFVSFS